MTWCFIGSGRWGVAGAVLAATVIGAFAACSSAGGVPEATGGSSSGGSAGSGAADGSGGSSGSSTGGTGTGGSGGSAGTFFVDGAAGTGGQPADDACAGHTQTATLIPLDLYVMLDESGSMTEDTGSGTKWDAVKQALTSFVQDPQSDGIGVGIQYFPLLKSGVPLTCTDSSQCGTSGPCVLRTCASGAQITPCDTVADCPGLFDSCIDLGSCTGDPNIFCAPVGSTACGTSGNCVKLASSFCTDSDSCLVGDYSNPAVEIAPLPGNSQALADSIAAQAPHGATPTGPALQGMIDHATAWAQQNPSHTVLAVFATDGLPTECAPTDINAIAALASTALAATPSIKTFVIGVFAATDTGAQQNLDAIAAAGGTSTAFIVDASGNVTQQFIDAMNQIRGTSLACDFEIPLPGDGGVLDYGKVNVQISSGGASTTLFYVTDASQCDPVSGGWYYDQDPAKGGKPTKIVVCTTSCDGYQNQAGAEAQIEVGCTTETKPPR